MSISSSVTYSTTGGVAVAASEDIISGDIVAVQHGAYGRTEGLVVGSHIDYAGRQIIEVQLAPGDVYHAWQPTVTRVRRVVHHTLPRVPVVKQRTIERQVYW